MTVLSFLFHSDVEAQAFKGALSRKQNSVSKVMDNAGCRMGWLSKVLSDSHIKPSQLRRLPVGQKVIMHGSCKEEPPASIADLSRMIIQVELSTLNNRKFKKEIETLLTSYKQLEIKASETAATNTNLRDKIDGLKNEIASQVKVLENAITTSKNVPFPLDMLLLSALTGVLFGVAGTWVYSTKKSKGEFHFPRSMSIAVDGTTHTFDFVGAGEPSPGSTSMIGKYKCPLCHERNLYGRESNLRAHIFKAHPQTRSSMGVDDSLKNFI